MRIKPLIVRFRIATTAVIGFVSFGLIVAMWYWWTFPYGNTHHACITNLNISLRIYAEQNGGFFPAGGTCPEASLSLLFYADDNPGAANLGGKTVSPKVAQKTLDNAGYLDR